MTTRPRLRTTHHPVERAPGEIRLGTGDDALTLTGLPPGLVSCLPLLDGITPLPHLEEHCADAGVPLTALHELLDALAHHGALECVDHSTRRIHRPRLDAPREERDGLVRHGLDDATAHRLLARLPRARVAVLGRGIVARDVAAALDGVVGSVECAPPGSSPACDLVVLVAQHAVDPIEAGRLLIARLPTLPVVSTGAGVVVGPWHGRPDEPCAACLDLRRTDADDAWPTMLRHLTATAQDGIAPAATADPLASRTAASVAAQWVRRRVVGLPETPGLTCEIDPWDLGMLHRAWGVHPRCGGHLVVGDHPRTGPDDPGHGDRSPERSRTRRGPSAA